MSFTAVASRGRAWRFRPYLAYARLGARQELDARAALLGRAGFLVVILFIFSRVWSAVFANAGLAGYSQAELLWYIAITEIVVLSFPQLHLDLESDFRAGEMLVRLSQPVSYLGARIAEAAGGAIVRTIVFVPVGIAVPFLVAGGFPAPPGGLWLALPAALPAIALALLSVAAVGVSAVWLHDVSPVYWIWQKLAFVFGGLLLPLQIYPGWLQTVAAWTPFAAMVNGPARLVFGADVASAALAVLRLGIWIALFALLLAWFWRRALRSLDGHGS